MKYEDKKKRWMDFPRESRINMLMATVRKVKTLEDLYKPSIILEMVAEELDDLFIRALSDQRKELIGGMKEIVKKSKPTFFGSGGMTDKEEQALQNGIYETRAQIYGDLFESERKE